LSHSPFPEKKNQRTSLLSCPPAGNRKGTSITLTERRKGGGAAPWSTDPARPSKGEQVAPQLNLGKREKRRKKIGLSSPGEKGIDRIGHSFRRRREGGPPSRKEKTKNEAVFLSVPCEEGGVWAFSQVYRTQVEQVPYPNLVRKRREGRGTFYQKRGKRR